MTPDATFEDAPAPPSSITDADALAFFYGFVEALAENALAPDARELALVTTIAHQIQHVAGVTAAIAETGYLVTGSKGQPVANPLLAVHSNAVNALNALLFKAKGILPADAADLVRPRGK